MGCLEVIQVFCALLMDKTSEVSEWFSCRAHVSQSRFYISNPAKVASRFVSFDRMTCTLGTQNELLSQPAVILVPVPCGEEGAVRTHLRNVFPCLFFICVQSIEKRWKSHDFCGWYLPLPNYDIECVSSCLIKRHTISWFSQERRCHATQLWGFAHATSVLWRLGEEYIKANYNLNFLLSEKQIQSTCPILCIIARRKRW